MRTIKIPQTIEKQTGNYQLPNSYDRKELRRGTIEYAVEVLSRIYKCQPKEAVPYNKVFDEQNYSDFQTYDTLSVGSGFASAEPVGYVFYGDIVMNTLDMPSLTQDFIIDVVGFKNPLNKSLGSFNTGSAYSASGGLGKQNTSNFNNAFASWIVWTNASGGLEFNYRNTVKFDGWLIRIA